jgi:hypothetical protein
MLVPRVPHNKIFNSYKNRRCSSIAHQNNNNEKEGEIYSFFHQLQINNIHANYEQDRVSSISDEKACMIIPGALGRHEQ